MKLVSACLAGFNCKWDGKSKPNKEIISMVLKREAIPICPEQLGGLTTPRDPAEQKDERIITNKGIDVTDNFYRGAKETANLATYYNIKEFIGKSKSPSCGCEQIYDGSFSGRLISGEGITVSLLRKIGIKCYSENNFT